MSENDFGTDEDVVIHARPKAEITAPDVFIITHSGG